MCSCGSHHKGPCGLAKNFEVRTVKSERLAPPDIKVHCEDMTALMQAKAYIAELEGREKALQAENTGLVKKLRAKQAELDSQPAEFKALKVDLQQAQLSITYYKNLADNSEARANRYQHKLASAEQKQSLVEDQVRKIDRLQAELGHQQTVNTNLSQENDTMADRYERLLQPYKKLMKDKDTSISILMARIDELVEEKTASVELSEVYDSLIDTLEHERDTTAQMVNIKSLSLRETEWFYSAMCSEVEPLHRFYEHACMLVYQYQVIFRNLSDPSVQDFAPSFAEIDTMLDSASDHLHGFQQISDMLQARDDSQNLAQTTLRVQIDNLARTAGRMYAHFDAIRSDIPGCLSRLENTSSVWTQLKGRFVGPSRPTSVASCIRPDSVLTHSRRSSVSSFASWTKCFLTDD